MSIDPNSGAPFWLFIGALAAFSVVMVFALVPFTVALAWPQTRPRANPASLGDVRAGLLALNSTDSPFRVSGRSPVELRLEWDVVDATWYEAFAKVRLSTSYTARLFLDEPGHEVRCHETLRSGEWWFGLDAGRLRFVWGLYYRSGVLNVLWAGRAYGIQSGFPPRIGKVYDFKLDTIDAKRRIAEASRKLGWSFRPVPLRVQVSPRGAALGHRLTPAFARGWSRAWCWGLIYCTAWAGIIGVALAGKLSEAGVMNASDWLKLAIFPGSFASLQTLCVVLVRRTQRPRPR